MNNIDTMLQEVALRFPIGQRVRYFPVAGEDMHRLATIRSEPWRLGHGAIVIKITGQTGGVHVGHLERIT